MKRGIGYLAGLLGIALAINFAVVRGRLFPVGGTGGDTIIHIAIARGIYLGRNPFLDQHYNVPPNWYPFLYHALLAALAKLTGASIQKVMIWLPVASAAAMVVSWYLFGNALGGRLSGLILGASSFVIMTSQLFPNPKSLLLVFLPLFYGGYLLYYRKPSRRWLVLSGVVLGLMMWIHSGASLPVLAGAALYSLLLWREDKNFLLPPLLSIVLFSPFVINVALHIHPGATGMVEGPWLDSLSWHATFDRVLPSWWILLALAVFLVLFLRDRFDADFWNFVFVMAGTMIVLNVLPVFIYHLGGPAVFPSRFAIPLQYTYLLVAGGGLSYLVDRIGPARGPATALALSLLLITYGSVTFIDYNYGCHASRYTYFNFSELAGNYTEGLVKVSDWINANTQRDDTLIGYPYTLEWIAGFTGRPVVAVSYGHGNPFLNMSQRRRDIARFFEDSSSRDFIILRYHVRYIVLGPKAESLYNITPDELGGEFTEVYSWGDFHVFRCG